MIPVIVNNHIIAEMVLVQLAVCYLADGITRTSLNSTGIRTKTHITERNYVMVLMVNS